MKNRNIYLYISGACFFAMCGSLWNEFVASDKSHLNRESLNRESLNPGSLNPVSHLNPESLNPETRYYAVPKTAVESFPFDPNEADSTQLLRLGLTPAQVRSIYRHRAKGYVYSTSEDFARTPFMTKGQWNHLKPLIKIGDQYKPVNLNLESLNPESKNLASRQDSIVNCQHSNKPNAEKLAYSAEARRMSMDEIHELSTVNCQLISSFVLRSSFFVLRSSFLLPPHHSHEVQLGLKASLPALRHFHTDGGCEIVHREIRGL